MPVIVFTGKMQMFTVRFHQNSPLIIFIYLFIYCAHTYFLLEVVQWLGITRSKHLERVEGWKV